MQVHIPATIEEAISTLGDLGLLISARQWKRAAIVATYVQPGEPGDNQHQVSRSGDLESASTFASRGIVGLASPTTVLRYVNAWLAQRPRPEPGETVDLDGLPTWPANSEGSRNVKEPERIEAIEAQAEADNTGKNMAVKIAGNAPALAAAIKADPQTAEAAAKALAATPSGRLAAQRAVDEAHTPQPKVHPPMPEPRITGSQIVDLVIEGVRVAIERAAREISGADLTGADRQALHDGNAENRQRLFDLDVLIDQGHVTDDALYAFMDQGSQS